MPDQSPPIQGFAHVNDTRLYYETVGSGPPLVFLHGYTLDHRMWDAQTAFFAPMYQVIRYDLRGFGQSALPEDGRRYAHYADLKALLDWLAVPKAHVVGLSMGAGVAIDFALAHPESVQSLVAAATAALDGYKWHETLAQWFAQIGALAAAGDLAAAKAYWLQTEWFAPAMQQTAVQTQLQQMVADYSGWHFTHANPVIGVRPRANERLTEITAPTLVVVGELDLPFYNLPIAARLAEQIPGARQVTLPGVGHMVNMEDVAAFNAALADFLAP